MGLSRSLRDSYMSLHKEYRRFHYFARLMREAYWVQFKNKCPVCKSDKIYVIEGSGTFAKWWCSDCCSMSYANKCAYCHKWNAQGGRGKQFKEHIYKEYRIGKWADDDTFYNACQKDFFLDMLKLHKDSYDLWETRYAEWKRRKHKQVLYGRG